MAQPLPDLDAGDLGGRGVLHQAVQGHGAAAAQPGVEVAQGHGDVRADALPGGGRGDPAYGQQVGGRDLDVRPGPVQLVRPLPQYAVEDLAADGDQSGVGHPGAVEAVLGLPFLVEADLGEGGGVRFRVPAGDVGGHPADGLGAAPVAGANQQLGVGAHEGGGHGDLGPVGQLEVGAVAEGLDQAEEVVPAARVQSRAVLAQFVEDLLHLEGGGDRLDEDGGADGAAGDVEEFLGEEEHVVPQARLVPVLQLGQVEVRAVARVDLPLGAVEEVQAEVDEGRGQGSAVDLQVLFEEVPAARSDHDGRELLAEAVLLALRGGEVDAPFDGVEQGQLAADDVVPGGGGGVLEVGHPNLGAGVQGVDGHPALRRAGDLDAAVGEAGRGWGDAPVRVLAQGAGGEREVERGAAGQVARAAVALLEDLQAAVRERGVEPADELQGLGRQDLLVALTRRTEDLDAAGQGERGMRFSSAGAVGGCPGKVPRAPVGRRKESAKRGSSGTALLRWIRRARSWRRPG